MATVEQAIIRVVDGHLVAGDEFRLALADIQARAASIVVKDRDSCEEGKRLVKKGNDQIAAVIAAAEPRRLFLQNALNELRDERDRIVAQFANVINPLDKTVRDWSIAEQEAAKKEQEQMNKGKRADDRVVVLPDVPTVAGTRFVVHYRVEVKNAAKVKRAWMMPDLVKINAEARKDKDPEKTMKKVGGIRVWKE